jgi:DMSO/TMAO reductase YedYZ molybdopterin-dependent catalytic subunit
MVVRSGGFRRPKIAPEQAERIPPGQFPTTRWPVLHQGPIPRFDPAKWDFRAFGFVERPLRLTWQEFTTLPRLTVTADLHCVTRWSRLDNLWEGVALRTIMELVEPLPDAGFLTFHCDGGYTTNLPLHALDGVVLALKHDGEDLTPEHGFPLRAVVPSRYAWKSAKWLRGIEFMAANRSGYWERYGYHDNADFWQEERFAE